jgi:hypothetical protein
MHMYIHTYDMYTYSFFSIEKKYNVEHKLIIPSVLKFPLPHFTEGRYTAFQSRAQLACCWSSFKEKVYN